MIPFNSCFRQAQHYDKVVRDYQKVKLLQDSDVALLEEVLSEIHLIISQFRAQLKNALHDPNGIIEEQTRLIALVSHYLLVRFT